MLPWDMMVTVNGYWHYKFRNVSEDDPFFPVNTTARRRRRDSPRGRR